MLVEKGATSLVKVGALAAEDCAGLAAGFTGRLALREVTASELAKTIPKTAETLAIARVMCASIAKIWE